MNSLTQINDTQVSVVNFKSIPVVTTAMLAEFYGTEPVRIQQNQHENKQRFIEGKHFFKIVGQELKDFVTSLKLVANFPTISNKTRSLILWTERGAARHAKILDTNQAWEVFEQLEDCYFHRQEILAKTHKSDREPLTNAVNMLVAKTKHLNYSEAYKLVHQRFNVEHIEDIPFESIPVAVEYIHHLIALYSSANKQEQQLSNSAHNAMCHMLWVSAWWRCYAESFRMLNPTMADRINDHFTDGAFNASLALNETDRKKEKDKVLKVYPYHLRRHELQTFLRKEQQRMG